MQNIESYSTEIFFTPNWHWKNSSMLGDLKGELAYINEFGLVELIGKKDPDLNKNYIESRTDGATKCITAKKSSGIL